MVNLALVIFKHNIDDDMEVFLQVCLLLLSFKCRKSINHQSWKSQISKFSGDHGGGGGNLQ